MKKRTAFLALVLCLILAMSACAPAAPSVAEPTADHTAEPGEPASAPEEEAPLYTAGSYTASAVGRNAAIVIECEFSEDAIVSVTATDSQETAGVGDEAINMLSEAIVKYQSLGVDSVAGATITSYAVKQAVADCVTQAGGDADALKNAPFDKGNPASIEETYDAVIVGSGAAGMAAAIAAVEQGASVVILETNDVIGGNTLVSGMGWNAVDPEECAVTPAQSGQNALLQEFLEMDEADVGDFAPALTALKKQIKEYLESGAETEFDSVELHEMQFFTGCVRTGLDGTEVRPDYELCKYFCENSLDTIHWLEGMGVEFMSGMKTIVGGLWPRGHNFQSKTGAFAVMRSQIENNGGVIMAGTHADELIVENGRVTGVKATYDGSVPAVFHAEKAVILASGGFGGNREMADYYNNYWEGGLLNARTDQIASTQGDGITMAVAIGADVEGMGYTQLYPAVNIITAEVGPGGGRGADMNCYINKNGERFVNEYASRDVMAKAALNQPDGIFYDVFDQDQMDYSFSIHYSATTEGAIEVYKAKGALFQCDTVEEMAEIIGCDAATLQATIDAYNEASKNAYDPLTGRTNFSDTLDNPPYYLKPVSPVIHNTMGGLKINIENAVISIDGTPIPGLYAAGEVTGGIHAGNRLGGNAIGEAFTMGRNAGTNAVK